MCTLLLAHRLFPGAPLVVAANRDELLSRPASGPKVYPGPPKVLMPRDELAFGTWLGLNEHGVFVGITNRFGRPPDPSRASRGSLVVRALHAPSAEALHRELSNLSGHEHNGFHLLYADREDAFVTWSDGENIRQYRVEPGLHVVTERSLGADDRGRTEMVERLFEQTVNGQEPTVEKLASLLKVHGPDHERLAGTCIHADEKGYGTRSSFVFIGRERPEAAWCEGKPCRHPFVDLAPMLEELGLRRG